MRRFAADPAGTTLVALGNFTAVAGQDREQAFRVDLTTSPKATLSPWYAPRFDEPCSDSIPNFSRGVDFSPDGSYFVIVTSGGAHGTDGLCDGAARFETPDISPTAEPTWINWTGGDSLYSVAVTGVAVYVGGHQRWLDNPEGRNSAGPGAVSRPGIGAIDPVAGTALSWNPTKTRGHGTEKLYVTAAGPLGRQRRQHLRRPGPSRHRVLPRPEVARPPARTPSVRSPAMAERRAGVGRGRDPVGGCSWSRSGSSRWPG